jgi:Alpha/beta hydrolase family
VGEGPPVVLIGGAFKDRTTTWALAQVLGPAFTAVSYDRRGRGTSGDDAAPAFAVAREIDDLAALVAELGGDAGSGSGSGDEPAVALFGHSSGAILALEAAAAGVPTRRLAPYEARYVIDDGTSGVPADDLFEQVTAAVGAGDREGAVELFRVEGVGVPAGALGMVRGDDETWSTMIGLAHTLPYDVAVCGRANAPPADRLGALRVPTLALDGGESPPWFHNAMTAVAATVPGARYVTIPGQDHGILAHPETTADGLTGSCHDPPGGRDESRAVLAVAHRAELDGEQGRSCGDPHGG